jgi:hypothetical protein
VAAAAVLVVQILEKRVAMVLSLLLIELHNHPKKIKTTNL